MKAQIPKDKYFYINTKEEMVETMKTPIIAALKLVMDQLFETINRAGFDYKEVKEEEPAPIKNARTSIDTYQTIINKLENDEDLEPFDFDSIILVCKTCSIIFDNHIKSLKESSQELSKIAWKIAHLKLSTPKMEEVLQGTKNLTK